MFTETWLNTAMISALDGFKLKRVVSCEWKEGGPGEFVNDR